jgi:dTDP-4-dehydrorhamnose reductase|tara:strand:- start:32253 stop:33095 length:843 start_codon:yes stop_codon:yes gene_type:complete
MQVLVFGKTGQVASELAARPNVTALARDIADFSDPEAIIKIIEDTRTDIIINAVAYTAVDSSEKDEDLATVINGTTVAQIAIVAAARNIPFLHISSDYVFKGNGFKAWKPDDQTNPLSAYGRSKLHGEHGVTAAGGPHVILRTSWVFSSHGTNFVKTMLGLGLSRETLSIVNDQIGGPTEAADIADALWTIALAFYAGNGVTDIYHFSGTPNCSWAEFASEIFLQSHIVIKVDPIPSSDFPTLAIRPLNSRLDCSSLEKDYGIIQPNWRKSLSRVLLNLK